MSKWKCNKAGSVNDCCCAVPCYVELDSDVFAPPQGRCIFDDKRTAVWEKVDEEQEQTDKNSVQLPLLTAEVFDRPDCPEWARYAALGGNGVLIFYEDKPMMSKDEYPKRWINYDRWYPVEGTKFDATDWKNSLIERPAAKLPDWCKVGEWVYYFDEVEGHSYQKIDKIDDKYIYFYRKFARSKPSDYFVSDSVVYSVFIENTKQARLRPYNAEEMRGLVGEVLKTADGDMQLITSFYKSTVRVVVGGLVDRPASEILEIYTHLDGSPCGCLEHLENGVWVK